MNLSLNRFATIIGIMILGFDGIAQEDLTPCRLTEIKEYYSEYAFQDSNSYELVETPEYILEFSPIEKYDYLNLLKNTKQQIFYSRIEMYLPFSSSEYLDSCLIKNDEKLISKNDTFFVLHGSLKDSIIPSFRSYGDLDFVEYNYCGFVKELEIYVFWIDLYEGGHYRMIDYNSMKVYDMFGYPKVSPNKSKILSSYYDIDIGYYFNGLEIHCIDDIVNPIIRYSPNSVWGIEGAYWKDENTIYFIHLYFENGDVNKQKRFLQKLTIKPGH